MRRERLVAADGEDVRVRVRRAQHLEMQKPVHRHVHRIACATGDDSLGERVRHARAAGLAGNVRLDGGDAGERVADRAVTGAPAQVAFEGMRQIRPLLLVECGGRHDHACGAIAALERLRIEESLLHRMQGAVLGKPFDGCDSASGGAEGRHQTRVNGCAVEPYGTGAAIARIAALLDAKGAEFA